MIHTLRLKVAAFSVGALALLGLFTIISLAQASVTAAQLTGTWYMTSEAVIVGANQITSPVVNKIITFGTSGTVTEDYGSLGGYDATVASSPGTLTSTCDSSGFITTSFLVTSTGFTVDANTRNIGSDPSVDCSAGGSTVTTSAAPAIFFTTADAGGTAVWSAELEQEVIVDTDDVLETLTLSSTNAGGITVEQEYQRIGVAEDTVVDNGDDDTDTPVDDTEETDGEGVTVPEDGTTTQTPPTNNNGTIPLTHVETDVDNDGVLDTEDDHIGPRPGLPVGDFIPTQDEINLQLELDAIPSPAVPPSYSLITDGEVVLTADQENILAGQLGDSISAGTVINFSDAIVDDADPGTVPVVTIVTERGLASRTHVPTITISGDLGVVHTGLPENLSILPHFAILSLFSDPTVRIAQADVDGSWTLTVPAELFDEGEHVVYAAGEVNGTRSDQVEITRFVIQEETRLSNTTWLVIVNGVILGIILVALIVVQVRKSHEDTEDVVSPKQPSA